MRTLIGCLALGLIGWHFLDMLPTPTQAVLAAAAPIQEPLPSPNPKNWTFHGYLICPLARYTVRARVLHRESYFLDAEAPISSLDLALGWGRMSDPRVYDHLFISQGSRWYTYAWRGSPPIPDEEIVSSSANTHIITADPQVRGRLFWVRVGDVIRLSGYLVEVDGKAGWHWRSSLTRTDTGNGSCEVMWVDQAESIGR